MSTIDPPEFQPGERERILEQMADDHETYDWETPGCPPLVTVAIGIVGGVDIGVQVPADVARYLQHVVAKAAEADDLRERIAQAVKELLTASTKGDQA